jgi:hypothetical protein
MQAVEYGSAEVIAMLVAELQAVRKREAARDAVIEALQAEIAALKAAQ